MQQVGYLAQHVQLPGHPEAQLYAECLRATVVSLREHSYLRPGAG